MQGGVLLFEKIYHAEIVMGLSKATTGIRGQSY